uniref:Uncharacterized protein n=1 Tax=Desertifilum tharense IPPAS B-1220 TaxID=1781255 RepID=A0ACD5GVI5_9CYAN
MGVGGWGRRELGKKGVGSWELGVGEEGSWELREEGECSINFALSSYSEYRF